MATDERFSHLPVSTTVERMIPELQAKEGIVIHAGNGTYIILRKVGEEIRVLHEIPVQEGGSNYCCYKIGTDVEELFEGYQSCTIGFALNDLRIRHMKDPLYIEYQEFLYGLAYIGLSKREQLFE